MHSRKIIFGDVHHELKRIIVAGDVHDEEIIQSACQIFQRLMESERQFENNIPKDVLSLRSDHTTAKLPSDSMLGHPEVLAVEVWTQRCKVRRSHPPSSKCRDCIATD